MRPAGITVALAMCWLAGVVGGASLPPDDQYSPQQSPYKKDSAARGPRGYQNWLEYHQDPSTRLEPPENKPGVTILRASDLSRERSARKDSELRDLGILSLAPGGWNVATARIMSNFTGPPYPEIDVPEENLEIPSASREDPFEADDNFQDQGPGSVEVYKLDLRRENSLLVPQAKRKQPAVISRIKSKIPKKAKGDAILWKLKPIEPSETLLPAIFQQPPSIAREPRRKIEENRKDEVSVVGGVPELQVGCEGLETSDRRRRSSGSGEEDSDEEYWPKFKDPVYRESTEPILLRVTPIVLDFEDEPPSGQIYEELDELLKLKSTTTPEPTTKRTNRGDIDPALENYQRGEVTMDEILPERGDLGPNSSKDSSIIERSIHPEDSQSSKVEGVRFPRETNGEETPLTTGDGGEDGDTLSSIIGSRTETLNHRGGRKLLWVRDPEEHENQVRTRHHQGVNEQQRPTLWGFGEDDGEISGDESDADKLRKVENEKRRGEYERRRQEDLEKRRGDHHRRPHSQEHPSRSDERLSDIERIRKEYERQQEKEQRERQRVEEERRRQGDRRQLEDEERRVEEAKRRQSEEIERRNRVPSHSRGREEEETRREWNRRREEEEERRVRLEDEENNQAPPSPLTRPSPNHRPDNRSRSQQEEERREAEDRKLREYIKRNHPIDVKKSDNRRRPEDQTKRRNEDEERRKHIEAQRRRQMEVERRRQQKEKERRGQMEEQQRRQESPDEDERRRQMEEQRRRHQPDEDRAREERRRQLEKERKLQDYVRRNQPVNVPRRNSSQEKGWQEQRRTIDEARQWEHNRQQITRTKDGRSHGPSAPASIGQRQSQEDLEELRRRQETEKFEAERRRFQEEGRRREEEYRREESRRHEEERRRLEVARQKEESNGRRPNWQDSHSPTSTSHKGGEVRDREAVELRRHETSHRRNVTNNGRRRPQHEDTRLNGQRQRGESVRNADETERRRQEEARLSALPVSARIIVRSDEASSRAVGALTTATTLPPSISIGSRGGFGTGIDFPAINPNRPGLSAPRFPAAPTQRPPSKSPSACVWAIVNCCPAKNRLTACFEALGCPGVNWDPSPCRASIQSAAQAQVVGFYETS